MAEISALHQAVGRTFVCVTQDQVEAMTMATRIVVMDKGVVQQIDTPQAIYDRPANVFVARFVGSPPMNLIPVERDGDRLHHRRPALLLGLRPEQISVPWSVYYVQGDSTPERLDAQTRFVRALGRGMDWVLTRPAAEYGDFLARTFPKFDVAHVVRLVDSYRAHGMWTTPRLDVAAFERWQTGIAAARLIAAPIAYDAMIDTRPLAGLLD